MSRPKPADVEGAFNTLRGGYLDDESKPQRDHGLRALEASVRDILERDRAGSPIPDGFGTGGSGPSGHGVSRPTETAGMLRADADIRDELHAIAERAWGYLQQAQASLNALRSQVAKAENLTGRAPDPPRCESCARAGKVADMFRFTDLEGRLERNWRLCNWCYDVVRRTDKLPAVERVVAYHEGRAFRERAS